MRPGPMERLDAALARLDPFRSGRAARGPRRSRLRIRPWYLCRSMPGALIIFDFDGTLADTWRDIFTALNQTLHAAGWRSASGAQVRH